jgi:hypothetical protein
MHLPGDGAFLAAASGQGIRRETNNNEERQKNIMAELMYALFTGELKLFGTPDKSRELPNRHSEKIEIADAMIGRVVESGAGHRTNPLPKPGSAVLNNREN